MPLSASLDAVKRAARRAARSAVLRYLRAEPRPDEPERIFIFLWTAFTMGGTIRAALNLAEYLAGRGHQVELISGYRRKEDAFFGEFPPGVQVTVLDDHRPGHGPRGPARIARAVLRRFPSLFSHPEDRAEQDFSLWTDLRLARLLRGRRGVVLGTRPALNLMIAWLAPPGVRAVGLEQMNLRTHSEPLREEIKRTYPRLDACVVLTEQDRKRYRRLLRDRIPVEVIPNTARMLEGPKADLDAPVVFTAGRLRYQKGFDLLVPAWARVVRDHPEWRLRICGRGDKREALEELLTELDLDGSVYLEGPSTQIAEDMASSSIFVLSSRFEGFPLLLIEAMSKGMAVVSFACPTGPADIIEHRRNGLLVPPKDVDALAAAIGEMISDRDLRRSCGAAAVETARQFTIEAIGPRWTALLDQLGASRR